MAEIVVSNIMSFPKINNIILQRKNEIPRIDVFVYDILYKLTSFYIKIGCDRYGRSVVYKRFQNKYYEKQSMNEFLQHWNYIENLQEGANLLPFQEPIKGVKKVLFLVGAGISFGSYIPLQKEIEEILRKLGYSSLEELKNNK